MVLAVPVAWRRAAEAGSPPAVTVEFKICTATKHTPAPSRMSSIGTAPENASPNTIGTRIGLQLAISTLKIDTMAIAIRHARAPSSYSPPAMRGKSAFATAATSEEEMLESVTASAYRPSWVELTSPAISSWSRRAFAVLAIVPIQLFKPNRTELTVTDHRNLQGREPLRAISNGMLLRIPVER